jgi:hypothetical protein
MDYIGQFVGGDGTDFKKLIKIIVPITSGWIHAGLFSWPYLSCFKFSVNNINARLNGLGLIRSHLSYKQNQLINKMSLWRVLNIANSSWHWGSYGSIWTGPSPKKYYMDRSFRDPYNIFLVTDRSIYCHMTRGDMNYFLYYTFYLK